MVPNFVSFYLQYYGNDYFNDDYYFIDDNEPPLIANEEYYAMDGVFGLHDDRNNLEKNIEFYKDIIPNEFLPIADMPICRAAMLYA